jgi:hypothetical protein
MPGRQEIQLLQSWVQSHITLVFYCRKRRAGPLFGGPPLANASRATGLAAKRGLWPTGLRGADREGPAGRVRTRLRKDFLHDLPMHVGQAEIAAAKAIGKSLVIQPQKVQDRGVQIVNRARILYGLHA